MCGSNPIIDAMAKLVDPSSIFKAYIQQKKMRFISFYGPRFKYGLVVWAQWQKHNYASQARVKLMLQEQDPKKAEESLLIQGFGSGSNYPFFLSHKIFLLLPFFNFFLLIYLFIYLMVEIQSCFFQLLISIIQSYCILCNTRSV